MANIALIDDDPTEALVLEGMLAHGDGHHEMTHFGALEDFPGYPDNARFDLVLLDRRIPPHVDFDTSLEFLAKIGFAGAIVPISASDMDAPEAAGLEVKPPVLKSELLTPEAVTHLINRVLTSDQ